jgi:peptidoglycan/LPS O-acetylase OafA/YrhL
MVKILPRVWNPRIEGLRGVSILLVFVFHLTNNTTHNWGALGVAIFFVISGYVITGSMVKELANTPNSSLQVKKFLIDFYIRRGRRLLPLATLVIATTLAISLFDAENDKRQYILSAIFCFLYIGNLFGFTFGYTDLAPALGHFWSLAVEEQFYLIWPILFVLGFKKLSRKRNFVVLITSGIVLITISHPLIAMAGVTVWTLPTTYFDLLLLGCGLRMITEKVEDLNGWRLRVMKIAGLISLSAIVFIEKFPSTGTFSIFQYNFNFLVAGVCFVYALNSKFFESKILMFFGKISYSLYCIHAPLFIYCRSFIGDSTLLMSLTAIVSVLLAFLSHKYFESKFYKTAKID